MAKKPTPDQLRALINQIDGLDDDLDFEPTNTKIAGFVKSIKARDAIKHEPVIVEKQEKTVEVYIPPREPYVVATHNGYHPIYGTKQYTNVKIEYVSAPCAAGKTYALIKSLNQNIHTKYIICVPTVALANQYEEALMANKHTAPRTAVIHGENTLDSVPSAITKLINEPRHGQIIVCTYAGFSLIEARYIPREWVFVHDEFPAVIHPYKPQLPHSHHILTDHMQSHECDIKELLKISCKDLVMTTEWFRTHQSDDIENHVRSIINHLRNDDAIFALKDNYTRVVTNGIVTKDKDNANEYGNEKNKLFFVALTNPEIYANRKVIFMGADFSESWINLVWGRFYNVEFVENAEITKALRYKKHTASQAERLHIFPFQTNFATGGASRKFREDTGSSYLLDRINVGLDMFEGDKVLAVFNNKDAKLCPAEFDLGKPILHGLNLYSDYTQAFLSICINLDETTMKMINLLGISKKEVLTASHMQINYQAACRINIRDLASDKTCYLFCADQPTAAYIASKFQGCHLYNRYGQEIHNPVIIDERSYNEKRNASNQMSHVLAGFLAGSNLIDLDKKVAGQVNQGLQQVTWTGFKALSGLDSAIAMAQNEDGSYGRTGKMIEFVKILRNLHASNTFPEKEDNFLLNTCGYKSFGLCDTDIAYKSVMILDIDGFKKTKTDHMTAAELHEILTRNKLAHYIHSSASNTPTHNKYRCFIFVNELMDKKTHAAVYDYLLDLLKDNGFHTVDENKVAELKEANPSMRFTGMDPVSGRFGHRYYVPGRLNNSPDENSFELFEFLTENRDIVRHAIKVSEVTAPYIAAIEEKEERLAIQLQFKNVIPERPVLKAGSKFAELQQRAFDARNDPQKERVINRINTEISFDNNRHNKAISICGSIGQIDDLDIRTELWNMLMMQLESTGGIDRKSNLIKDGRKFAQV
jgi:hypothetical protein